MFFDSGNLKRKGESISVHQSNCYDGILRIKRLIVDENIDIITDGIYYS